MIYTDIETTGLEPYSKFKVAAITETGEEAKVYWDASAYQVDIYRHASDGHKIFMHNFFGFDGPWLYHNCYYDFLSFTDTMYDTLLLSRLLYPKKTNHGLGEWAKRLREEDRSCPLKHAIHDWEECSKEDIEKRVVDDVCIQKYLSDHLEAHPKFEEIHKVYRLMVKGFMCQAMGVGAGIPISKPRMWRGFKRIMGLMRVERDKIHKVLPNLKNPNSNIQVNKELMSKYGRGLPLGDPSEKTKKRTPTLNAKNKEAMAIKYPELVPILAWKDLNKQKTYITPRPKKHAASSLYLAEHNGRIYPGLSVMAQDGLRSNYSRPPLNQIDKRIRDVFYLRDHIWVGADIEALELSMLGYLLKEYFGNSVLWDEVKRGVDAKARTLKIFGNFFKNVPEGMRRDAAKKMFYAITYGQAPTASLKFLNYPVNEENIREFKRRWDMRLPSIKALDNLCRKQLDNKGTITNLFGVERMVAGYAAVNRQVSSSGTVYANHILGEFGYQLMETYPDAVPLLNNHDEIQFLLKRRPLGTVKREADIIKERVHNNLTIPLIAGLNVSVGETWKESH